MAKPALVSTERRGDAEEPRDAPGAVTRSGHPARTHDGELTAEGSGGDTEVLPAGPGDGRDPVRAVSTAFEIAKADVDTQFRIAERFDTKARGYFAIAAGVFAAAQAVALRQDVLDALSKNERSTVLSWAIVAGCALTTAMIATAVATMLKSDVVVDPVELRTLFNEADEPWKTEELVSYYMDIMQKRQNANAGRRVRLYIALACCAMAIVASAIELLVALDAFS